MGNLPSYYFQTHGNAEQMLKLHDQLKKKTKQNQPTIKQTTERKSPGPQNKEEVGVRTTGRG